LEVILEIYKFANIINMEKKNIFDTDLNSLMGGNDEAPIEVEGSGDGYIDNTFFDEKEKEKEKEEEEDLGLIDIDPSEEEEEVEETEEEINEEEPSSPSQKKSNAKSSSPLTPYAKLLKEEGILPNLDVDNFDGTSDSLKEAMIDEVFGLVEEYKSSLPDRLKTLIDNYEEGVPFEKLLELDRNKTNILSIDKDTLLEDTDLQKNVVKEYLKKTTKFTDKKIDSLIEKYEDSGDLESEAESNYDELKSLLDEDERLAKEAAEKERKSADAERTRTITELNKKITESKEIIPGLPLNDGLRKAVFASLTTPAGKDQNGNPLNRIVVARMDNPLEFEIKLHYLFEVTKGFTDFSKITDKAKKDTSKEFEEAIERLDKTDNSDFGSRKNKPSKMHTILQKTYGFKE